MLLEKGISRLENPSYNSVPLLRYVEHTNGCFGRHSTEVGYHPRAITPPSSAGGNEK